jgi:uroporphyrinogen decarboxylase
LESPRERILKALRGILPERIPVFDFLFSQKLFQDILGRKPDSYNFEDVVDLTLTLRLDAVFIPFGGYSREYLGENTYRDEWGTTYRVDYEASWPIDPPIAFPVRNREDWKNYVFPDPCLPHRIKEIKGAVRKARGEIAVFGGISGPFTAAWLLLGLENMFVLLYDDLPLVRDVLEKCTDFFVEAGKKVVEAGADVLLVSDDLGFKSALFMSPEQFRDFVVPLLARQIRALLPLGVPIVFHSDGKIDAILGDIVEMGISGYHPVEREAGMDIGLLRKAYPELCLLGNVNNKTTLVFGSPEDVIAEAAECTLVAGLKGRYVLASDHSIHHDVPVENVLAMIEFAERYGWYPLDVELLKTIAGGGKSRF